MRFLKAILPLPILCFGLLFSPVDSGADVSDPVVSISPGHFAFGPINVGGELGEPGEFTITNTGPVGVQLHDFELSGSDPFSFKILPLGSTCTFIEPRLFLFPGASCTVVTVFDPESEGPKQANLVITSDSVTSPDVMPLTGTGFPRMLPGATIDPQTLEFGEVETGTESEFSSITLTSSGDGDLRIDRPILLGADADQFRVIWNNCSNRSMASGDSCQVRVRFDPTGTGARTATLTLPTDAEGADTTVDLSGIATARVVDRSSRVRTARNLPRLRKLRSQIVPLRCQVTNMDLCRGRVTIKVKGRRIGRPNDRLVRIGSQTYALTDGDHKIQVKLGGAAMKVIRRGVPLMVRVITTSRQGDGSVLTNDAMRTIRR